jgi:23S rRNA (cytosine1962-C5)-methyltransferase
MESLPTVLLRPGEADRVLAGHPWIYEGSILRMASSDPSESPPGHAIEDGEIVQVKDHRQRLLGVGFFNSKSKIRVRLLARERVQIDRAFFRARITTARALREHHLPGATSFRVVNSESDLLSGLIVDKYDDVLVMQVSALGMDQRKAEVVHVLEELFQPRAILERNDVASRKFEGLAAFTEGHPGILSGSLDSYGGSVVSVRLNGLVFETDLGSGHKTGMYLDQQVNYKLVAQLVRELAGARPAEAQVLDCFSFVGGFALHTAQAGAAHVHGIDQSEQAIAQARRNATLNGLSERCSFDAANVFDWLKAQTVTRPHEKIIPRFDLIVLDPPSFTRNRAAVPDALRGYKEIHLRALKLLKSGGTLATFCCSHHVDAQLFQEVILSAAYDARRVLRRTAIYTQSPDHPVVPSIPETEYLKGFAFEVLQQF